MNMHAPSVIHVLLLPDSTCCRSRPRGKMSKWWKVKMSAKRYLEKQTNADSRYSIVESCIHMEIRK